MGWWSSALANKLTLTKLSRLCANWVFVHIISLMDIYEIHNPFRLPQELEDNGFQYYINQRERIESCLDIFADDAQQGNLCSVSADPSAA